MPPGDEQQQGALNRATGLPFSDSTTTYSPQVNTSQVQNTPERQGFVNAEQAAFQQQADAEKALAVREADIARQQADIMRGQAMQDEQYAVERERIRQEHSTRIAEAQDMQRQRINEAMKDPGGFWDNKTSLDKTMTRILIGLGSLGAGDNRVLAMVNDEIEKDLKSKQQRSERLFKQAELARGYMSDALRNRAEELSDLDTNRAALWNIVAKRTELAAKSGMAGKLTAEMAAKVATIQQAAAQAGIKSSEAVAAKVDVQGGHTSTTQAINQSGQQSGLSPSAAEGAESYRQQAGFLDEYRDLIKKNPKAAEILRDANKEQIESEKLEGTGLAKAQKLLQWAGVQPSTLDQRIAKMAGDDKALATAARRMNTLQPIVRTGIARFFDPVGPLGESSQKAAVAHSNLLTSTPDEMSASAQWFSDQFKNKAAAIESTSKTPGSTAASNEARRASMGGAQPSTRGPTTAQARTQIETVPDLIAKGKAAKAAGNLKEAARIHEQVKKLMGGGQ